MELVHQLIAGFSGRKRKAAENVQGVQDAGNYQGHESVHMGTKRRCRVYLTKKERNETAKFAMFTFVKMGVILSIIMDNKYFKL